MEFEQLLDVAEHAFEVAGVGSSSPAASSACSSTHATCRAAIAGRLHGAAAQPGADDPARARGPDHRRHHPDGRHRSDPRERRDARADRAGRTFLSFSLDIEMDGVVPWRRRATEGPPGPDRPEPAGQASSPAPEGSGLDRCLVGRPSPAGCQLPDGVTASASAAASLIAPRSPRRRDGLDLLGGRHLRLDGRRVGCGHEREDPGRARRDDAGQLLLDSSRWARFRALPAAAPAAPSATAPATMVAGRNTAATTPRRCPT